jgi:hypothetical protein
LLQQSFLNPAINDLANEPTLQHLLSEKFGAAEAGVLVNENA